MKLVVSTRLLWTYAVALLLVSGMMKAFLPGLPGYLDITLLSLLVLIMLAALNPREVGQRLASIRPYARWGLWATVVLAMLMTASLTYTPSLSESRSKLILFYLLPVYLVAGICVPRSRTATVLGLACLSTLFAVGYIYVNAESIVVERQGPDGNLAVLSVYLTASLFCGFSALMILGGALNVGRLTRVALVTILVGSMFLLGGRGPSMGFVVALSMVWLFRLPKARGQLASLLVAIVGAAIVAAAMAAAFFTYSADGGTLLLDRAMDRFGSLGDLEASRSFLERQIHIDTIGRAFYETPAALIFGFGIGSYGLERYGMDVFSHPHNIFLEVAFETGIVGLTALVVMLGLFGAAIWRTLNGYGAGIFVFLVLNAAKSSSIVEQRVMFILLGMLVVYTIGQTRNARQRA